MAGAPQKRPGYRFGPFELNLEEDALLRNGTRVKVQDLPYRLCMGDHSNIFRTLVPGLGRASSGDSPSLPGCAYLRHAVAEFIRDPDVGSVEGYSAGSTPNSICPEHRASTGQQLGHGVVAIIHDPDICPVEGHTNRGTPNPPVRLDHCSRTC